VKSAQQKKLNVLIAEDDPLIMMFMTRLTAAEGHRVIEARDGREAVRLWESEDPHVIFMDVQMPYLDGVEATKIIRARERETGRHVPIVAVTAHVMEEDAEQCFSVGMTAHIGKPFNTHDFKRLLKDLCDSTHDGMDSHRPTGPAAV